MTGEDVGEIDEQDVQFLIDQLEEEDAEDRAYFVNSDTLELLRENGASEALMGLLRKATSKSGEAEIRWVEA